MVFKVTGPWTIPTAKPPGDEVVESSISYWAQTKVDDGITLLPRRVDRGVTFKQRHHRPSAVIDCIK